MNESLANYTFLPGPYKFKDADVEKLIATRDW
jgi:hypothetical protein